VQPLSENCRPQRRCAAAIRPTSSLLRCSPTERWSPAAT